jgi:hypothetical protein
VRRSASQIVSVAGNAFEQEFNSVAACWPELFPALSRLACAPSSEGAWVSALEVLLELIPTIGGGLSAQGATVASMLTSTLSDSSASIRSAGARRVLHMIECLEAVEIASLAQVMPGLTGMIHGLANECKEDELQETLQALPAAADVEADFFKKNGLSDLGTALIKICAYGPGTFGHEEVRHSAMKAIMSFAIGFENELGPAKGHPMLEQLIAINFSWMCEVEEDLERWTKEGKETEDDECDDDVVAIGKENLDRLAEHIDEGVMMLKVVRAAIQESGANWRPARSAIMAISQVVEHIEEETWVDQCVEFVAQISTTNTRESHTQSGGPSDRWVMTILHMHRKSMEVCCSLPSSQA